MKRLSDADIDALDVFWRPQAKSITTPENPQNRGVGWFTARAAGITVTPEIALQVSTVWACVEIITKAVSSQAWNVYERLPDGDRELLLNDQVAYLLNARANPEMSAISAREAITMAAVAFGNGYAEIEWDRMNRPVAIWPLSPDRVEPIRVDGRLCYRVYNQLGPATILEMEDVIHIHGIGLSGLVGNNIIHQATHTIALSIAAERFAETYFGNNTQIGGVLTYPQKLDDPSFARLKQEWIETHAGPRNAHRPAILDQGAKWEQMAVGAEDAQMNQTRQAQVVEICRWFGVPPHKVAELTRSTNNNIEHQGMEFVRDACKPWAVRSQQEIDYKLLDTRGKDRFSEIDLEPLSQGDAVSRMTYYTGMRAMGVYNANDILKMEHKNTIGAEGDIRIVNSASIRLQDVGKAGTPTGPADAKKPPDPTIANMSREVFASLFERIEARRSARHADLSASKSGDELAAGMRFFAAQQIGYLNDNLRQPCEALGAIVKVDLFPCALAAGHRVASGAQSANDAASEVMKIAFGECA